MSQDHPETKIDTESPTDKASETDTSRRDFLILGARMTAGVGVAALLGDVGGWALSYAAEKEPIKIGVLHSLSGTMAISEVSLRNVFYTGAAVNQQAVPAVDYLMSKEGGGHKKFYLLGSDYVYPRTTNKILRAMLLAKKVPLANIAEEYTPFHHQDYQTIVGKIKKFAAGGGAAVISTINGDSNVPFYKEFANQGLRAEDAPIMAFSVAEDELRGMDTSALVGHLAAWNYYQSVDTPQNKQFVANFKAYAKKSNLPGGDKRVTDDPMEAAYFGVYIWKQAAEKAKSFEVDTVRKAVYGQEFLGPGGKIKMDEANQHAYKPVLIGEILKDGQFKVVSRSKGLVKAEPWSQYTSPAKGCDWIKHQGTYQKKA